MVAVPTYRIQLFARFAELFGAEQIEIPAEGIRTVGDLLARVRALPGGSVIADATLVAVNLQQARAGTVVSPGDEVALLPPLAGG